MIASGFFYLSAGILQAMTEKIVVVGGGGLELATQLGQFRRSGGKCY